MTELCSSPERKLGKELRGALQAGLKKLQDLPAAAAVPEIWGLRSAKQPERAEPEHTGPADHLTELPSCPIEQGRPPKAAARGEKIGFIFYKRILAIQRRT